MLKKFLFIIVFITLCLVSVPVSFAKTAKPTPLPKAPPTPVESYETANVTRVLAEGVKVQQGTKNPYQKLQLQILSGSDKGKAITLTYGGVVSINANQEVNQGQTVVLMKSVTPQHATSYQIVDTYRLNNLYPIAILFLIIVLLVTRLKGLGAVVGLGISLFV